MEARDTRIELNCGSVKGLLLYFSEKYGREELARFIQGTGMDLDYIEDASNWISYEYWCRLLRALVEYTGDPRSPFDVSRFTALKGCYGAIQLFCTRLGTPSSTYRLMVQHASRYNKIGELEAADLKKNSCVLTVRYHAPYRQDKNNCLNLQGIFADAVASSPCEGQRSAVCCEWSGPLRL